MVEKQRQPLSGKVAFVTGGSRGIGAAIARRVAVEGADVALTYVGSAEKAEAERRGIEAGGRRAMALRADSADPVALTSAIDRAAAELGGLDILVSNAGIAVFKPLGELSFDDFDRTIAVNVRAVFVGAQAAARHMGEGGRIVTIGSTNADRMPMAGGTIYAMSKSALIGLTKGLARDLGPRGIAVSLVQPGPVDTDMNPADGPFAPMLTPMLAIPRYGRAEEIAGMVAYLAGPEAGYVSGSTLTIDGGFGA